jgi:hypothetical protein
MQLVLEPLNPLPRLLEEVLGTNLLEERPRDGSSRLRGELAEKVSRVVESRTFSASGTARLARPKVRAASVKSVSRISVD